MEEVLQIIKEGGVILYPTDTVWGLGCDATNEKAVARIFEIKRRSQTKALIMLVDNIDSMARYVKTMPTIASELIQTAENSSPLTLILEGGCGVASNVLPDEGTIAMRIPNHKFCIDLLRKLRRPLVSTSANFADEPTPLTFDDIDENIKSAVDYIVPIEYQGSPTGKPSSIISLSMSGAVRIIRQ